MNKYERESKGYRRILTGTEVLSRYFFAVALMRKHKEFTLNAVKLLLERFEDRFGRLPEVIQMDEGGEFYNTKVLPFFDEMGLFYKGWIKEVGHGGEGKPNTQDKDVEVL